MSSVTKEEWRAVKEHLLTVSRTLDAAGPSLRALLDVFECGIEGRLPRQWDKALELVRDPGYAQYKEAAGRYRAMEDAVRAGVIVRHFPVEATMVATAGAEKEEEKEAPPPPPQKRTRRVSKVSRNVHTLE